MGFFSFLLLATLEGLVQAAVLCLSALGLWLTFGIMRVVNVAHGTFFMLGAVLAWFITTTIDIHPGINFLIALIASPILVGSIAYISDRLILQRLNYQPEAVIVATIGLLLIIQQAVLLTFGPDARPVDPPFYFHVAFPWFGYSGYKLIIIFVTMMLLTFAWWGFSKTNFGLVMRATQYDSETAKTFGINVNRVYTIVFAVGSAFASLAAVLVVPVRQAHYLMGMEPLLLSFVVVIVGGLGSIRGILAAALIIGLSDGIISVFFSPTVAKMLSLFVVVVVLMVKPEGLFVKKKQ